MDIYMYSTLYIVHNRLCSAEVVGDGDIQISRIHKIHILLYQEAADEKHIYIGTYIIYWNLIVTSLPGLRLTLSSLNFELANLIPPRPTNQAHSSVTKFDSIEQLIKV